MVVWRYWLDLVLFLVKITFGHQVMKRLVQGKIDLCEIRVDLPGTEKFLQGDVKWQGWKREEWYCQGERGQGAPWPWGSVGHRAQRGRCGQHSSGRALKGGVQDVLVEKGMSSTTIIDGNYCLERLEVFKRLQTPEG